MRAISTQIVYVVGTSDSPVKIGIATSLTDRLAGLQIGNPDALICHHFVRVPLHLARVVERAAHAAFADRHRRGEWFDVSWLEAAKLLDELASRHRADDSDLLTVLRSEHGMRADGKSAVWRYLDLQERGDPFVPHANGYILRRLGTASYAAFSLVVAQQKPLSGLRGRELDSAHKALARAINALCVFGDRYDTTVSGKAQARIALAEYADARSLRPRNLPPLRKAG